MALVSWNLAGSYFPQVLKGYPRSIYWIYGLGTSILLFLSVLIHELCHSLVSRREGIRVRRITLFIFGGIAQIEKEPESPKSELKIAIAGPASSAIIFGIFTALTYFAVEIVRIYPLKFAFEFLAYVNGVLALFNMVPGFPLDGGRIFRAILWKRKKDLKKATFIASRAGKVFAGVLMFLGFINFFTGNVVGGIWFVLIGLFLIQAAESSYYQVVMKLALSGVPVKSIMTEQVITVESSLTIRELVDDYFLRYHHICYPVIEYGRAAGIIEVKDAKKVPKEEWTTTHVRELMTVLLEETSLHPRDEAVEALSKMVKTGRGRLPVVEGGEFKGIVTRRDIMNFLQIKTDLGI